MRGVLLVCVLCVAACDISQEQTDQITCQDLCRCLSGLPGQQTQCEANCVEFLTPLPAPCTQCVENNLDSCSMMVTECDPVCLPTVTTREGAP